MMFVKARCVRPSAVGFVKMVRLFMGGKISSRSDHSPHTVHFTIVVKKIISLTFLLSTENAKVTAKPAVGRNFCYTRN